VFSTRYKLDFCVFRRISVFRGLTHSYSDISELKQSLAIHSRINIFCVYIVISVDRERERERHVWWVQLIEHVR
jgi:hypothetical protein